MALLKDSLAVDSAEASRNTADPASSPRHLTNERGCRKGSASMDITQVEPPAAGVSKHLRLHAVFWNSLGPGSVAYTLTELLDNMPGDARRILWSLGQNAKWARDYSRPAIPELLYKILCKMNVPAASQGRIANYNVLRNLNPGDVVYLWPPYDLRLIDQARERGAVVVAERINCMGELVREVLTRAYARNGLRLPNGWCSPEAIEEEREQMLRCDFITAPNALVGQSARMAGVPNQRIVETSYGFDPRRLAKAIGIRRPDRAPVFAFVGLGIIRKGLDVLLEAWDLADVDGKLLIAGNVDDEIRARYERVLARGNVETLGFVEDIATVYAAADVFVFPTHEEGGPQVIYEAAACGLPSIVSPMGAGRIARNMKESLLVDPLSVDDLARALTTFAQSKELRESFGRSAAARSLEFTWSKVATRLAEKFRNLVA